MVYTEAEKKELRSCIYDWADEIYNDIMISISSGIYTNHTRMELEFLNGIKEGNFKLCLKLHKIMMKYEQGFLDIAMFEDKDITTQSLIKCSGNIKNGYDGRRKMLKYAMRIDQKIGYWKLSK